MAHHNTDTKTLSVLMVLITIFHRYSCECIQSYMLICETIEDFKKVNYASWTNVMIKSNKSGPPSPLVELDSDDLESVTDTFIVIGQINSITAHECSPGKSLRVFSLYENDIKKLHANTFSHIKPQKLLSLVKNQIEAIEAETFAWLNVQMIDLSDNLLEVILSNTFTNEYSKNSIETISIRNNKLGFIEAHSFPSNLTVLNLDNNELRFFQNEVIDYLYQLQGLFISHNEFYSIPAFNNLLKLKVLDISHNNVYNVDRTTFENLENLEFLDLSYNKIKDVEFLKPLFLRNKYFFVSLAFNHLLDLNLRIDKNVNLDSNSLVLFGNPWWCHRWLSIQKYLNETGMRQTECDLAHFNDGNFPFCFSFQGEPLIFPKELGKERYIALSSPVEITEDELKTFVEAIEQSEKLMDCELTPRLLFAYSYVKSHSCTGPGLYHLLLN